MNRYSMRTRRLPVVLMVLVCGSIFAGCGFGSNKVSVNPSSSPSGDVSPMGDTPSSPLPSGATPAPVASGQHGSTSGAVAHPTSTPSFPQAIPGSTPAPAQATLSAKCVTIGGTETLTVKTTPGFFLSFDTQYSDGTDGRKNGGWGTSKIPSNGTYTNTWVVAPTAPLGEAIVYIAISGTPNQSAFRQPKFTVASHC
ncbi:MAG: hypothetical protein ACYDGR_07815 [Candidatus Dormibacteria bacterium]